MALTVTAGPGCSRTRREERGHARRSSARQPYCVIVGGGGGGIALGARLKRLGVSDDHPRKQRAPGRFLAQPLHGRFRAARSGSRYDHLPYLPFPDDWPIFTPKDKLGDWLESHTPRLMELNYWVRRRNAFTRPMTKRRANGPCASIATARKSSRCGRASWRSRPAPMDFPDPPATARRSRRFAGEHHAFKATTRRGRSLCRQELRSSSAPTILRMDICADLWRHRAHASR